MPAPGFTTATAAGTLHLGFRFQQPLFEVEAAEAVADRYCGRLV